MKLTPEIWAALGRNLDGNCTAPTWVIHQLRLSFQEVISFPAYEAVSEGCDACPTIERKVLGKDYLDFLRQQVSVDARGPEWLNLLNSRIFALEPFVGRELITVRLHRKPQIVTVRITAKTLELVYLEELSWLDAASPAVPKT